MILDLGTAHEIIRVTAEYSNAVLVAVMPHISDYAQKLDLPVPHPTTTAHVQKCAVVPIQDAGASVLVNGDWVFWFRGGYVNGFQGPHSYFALQDPDETPKFYGQLKMSKGEAIELARKAITKLGVSLESVFAEQEPRVTGPVNVGTNIVPHFRIEWLNPRTASSPSVDAEVDGETRRLERLRIISPGLRAPPLKLGVIPPTAPGNRKWAPVNPEYAQRLLPVVLRAVEDYCQAVNLPVTKPLNTNHVARFFLDDNGGWPHSELELTNGWRFIYRNNMVNGFYAPDNLFSSDKKPILIKDFTGKWSMTEPEAAHLVQRVIAKLNYPTNLVHVDFRPDVTKPAVSGIPRFFVSWLYAPQGELVSKVEAEVDADKKEVKSLYYDHKSYWNHPPELGVPISLPVPGQTLQSTSEADSHRAPKPPKRPMLNTLPPR